jgi:hypothetical protein
MHPNLPLSLRMSAAGLAVALLAGCSTLVARAGDRFSTQLGAAVLNSEDPATVRDGLPAYLLLLDAMIQGDPQNAALLRSAAELNGAYAGNFAGDDAERALRLSNKAMAYARRATCVDLADLCAALDQDPERFAAAVAVQDADSVATLYALASSWAGLIQANRDDFGAVADLPKVESLLSRVVELAPEHQRGLPYVYLGVLNSLRPEAIGGKPELGRQYFERAIAMSQGNNLYAKTMMAEFYARLVYDQELHDRLLAEVLAADPRAEGFTLMNTLAQQRARALQESGRDYF